MRMHNSLWNIDAMYFKKEESEYGEYTDTLGQRWSISECRRVRPTDGWTRFDSRAECLAAWGLAPYPEQTVGQRA